jgi:hypothetical protein
MLDKGTIDQIWGFNAATSVRLETRYEPSGDGRPTSAAAASHRHDGLADLLVRLQVAMGLDDLASRTVRPVIAAGEPRATRAPNLTES